jgi:hypothetical protein
MNPEVDGYCVLRVLLVVVLGFVIAAFLLVIAEAITK